MTQTTIATPLGTRLQRIIRHDDKWQLWIATRDFKHGTYLLLYDDGRIQNVTEREDEGPIMFDVKGTDMNGGFW